MITIPSILIKAMTISQQRLKELVSYDPETGIFRWISRASYNTKVGSVAGCADALGYWRIAVDGRLYYAHRLAFIYMTGAAPKFVDHRDTRKGNNAWHNLRGATRQENAQNKGLTCKNTSGAKGVAFLARLGKWQAKIWHHGKTKNLGLFDSFEDAVEFRQLAADMLHGEFVRHA